MTSLETIHEIVRRIEKKVDKTNGTVGGLVKWKIETETTLKIVKGALLVMVVPVVLMFIQYHFWP